MAQVDKLLVQRTNLLHPTHAAATTWLPPRLHFMTNNESTLPRHARRDLRLSCNEGMCFGGMVGLGETFVPSFVLAAGLDELTAGLAGSVPLVAGGLLQMASPMAVRWLRSHKRWVVICALVQAFTFMPLAFAAFRGSIGRAEVFLISAVYWAAGLATGPAWNTWMGAIVPRQVRAKFFANRTLGQQTTVLAGFVAGGAALRWAEPRNQVLLAFGIMFAAAAACRILSVWLLSRQSDTKSRDALERLPWRRVLERLREGNGGRLLLYLVAVQAAVQMAGPYFTPFMFEKLGLSYSQFVALIAVAFLSKIIALPWWGRVGKRIGAPRLLWIGGLGIVPLGSAWLVSQHMAWLIAVQIVGGVMWAAYELAFFLMFFESIAERERTSLLTIYNLANTLAWLLGAILGAVLLWMWNASYNGYLTLFLLSTVGRCCCLLLLWRVEPISVMTGPIVVRFLGVRPSSASIDTPVLPSLPDQAPTSDDAND